ncbi:ABC transporter permease [Paenibacillus albicereus]|uniref:ABC transporter permease n=1 Tax=Paenibacillus albicereus TaxID=2726185 RepID=A0A6H2H3Q1_9BACL|nr:ABC transporter permease [Paenibacillus albicereus]QJC53968.1 ABC transporter permease [Paenibacillus albicereus]
MRIRSLAWRIIRQFLRDKRTLALLFLAPLLVLSLLYLVFGGDASAPKIGVAGSGPVAEAAAQRLELAGAAVTAYADPDEALDALGKQELDAVLDAASAPPQATLEGSDPTRSRAALALLRQAAAGSTASGADAAAPTGGAADGAGADPTQAAAPGEDAAGPAIGAAGMLEPAYLHGSAELTAFDSLGPALIGLFGFFFVFLLAGVSFLRERTTGTLERLLATPIRRHEVVAGYLGGFGLFTLAQAALIAWYSVSVLGLHREGPFWLVLLACLLLALTALTLGTLLSTFASSEFQIIQFIPLVIVPQVFFSGLFQLDSMNEAVRQIRWAMPLYYGADALKGVMLRGEGLAEVWPPLAALLGFALLFALLNVLALKKQRSA